MFTGILFYVIISSTKIKKNMHFLYCYIVDDIKKHFELFLEHLLTSMLIIVLLSITKD